MKTRVTTIGFAQCGHCHKWCYIPQDFDERKHFIQCTCKRKMYLQHNLDPIKDMMFPQTNMIFGSLIKQ